MEWNPDYFKRLISVVDALDHVVAAQAWVVLTALASLAPLATVGVVFFAWRTYRQKTRADTAALAQKSQADARAEWWKRAQWAVDAALSNDPGRRLAGSTALPFLQRENAPTRPDEEFLRAVAKEVIDSQLDKARAANVVDASDAVLHNGTRERIDRSGN